jgi:hypothetical protein
MPAGNTTLHERALKRALTHESIGLIWGAVVFAATKNPLAPSPDRTSPNDGDDTACTLHAVVSTEDGFLQPDNLPSQGDTFLDDAGRSYRVARIDYTPGLPAIVFHIPNVVTLP